ncbi:hypothetical protein [Noviherbaspirillum pedocola]|uniref:Uncharacterized protein n=1 Tax=Noviherbaspirillum pedocola TaxID=2801341 RepID=A0A934W7S5_9BURK|nr:hypothetical protein [Noviherbaspirillum pedocola]MBK4735009.1 hypothetical protein [Noviherbaspirillum pedocola]
MSSEPPAGTITAIVVAIASLGFAGYQVQRAGELARIAAEAHLHADATQRQYLSSLEHRIARLEEEGIQGDDNYDHDPIAQDPDKATAYQQGMLQAAQRHAKRLSGAAGRCPACTPHAMPR